MPKKYFTFTLLCALILLTGTFQHSQNFEQKGYKWKIVSVYDRNMPIYQVGMEKFVNDVNVISQGQLIIESYAAGEYKNIKAFDVFEVVSNGTVEMGYGTSLNWAVEKIPGSDFMYSIPFGLSAKDMHAWLYRGGGLELWREMYAPFNVIPFPVGDTGGAMGGWFNHEIKSIDDFKGMKIRTFGFNAQVYQKLWATTKYIPATIFMDDYNKHKIDAIICLGPYVDYQYRLYRGPKYYYYPGWQEPCGVLSLIINKNAWEKLPPHHRKTIEIVCGNTYQYISNQFDNMNSKTLQELVEKEGIQLREFPPEVMEEFRRLSTEFLEEEANKSPQFAKIYQSFKKFKKENVDSGWSKIVNEAVYFHTTAYSDTISSKFIEGLADIKVAKVVPKGNNSVVITFSGFTTWSSNLPTDLVSRIERIAKIISDNSFSIKGIRVEGHSATAGEDCANWAISKMRANAVEKLLIDKGIDKSLIKVIPRGEGDPIIYPDDTEEKRSMNRRVEIVIEF
jgi:TRAP-type mannitol/chloroaromatic compound transport system substrate-binding protein